MTLEDYAKRLKEKLQAAHQNPANFEENHSRQSDFPDWSLFSNWTLEIGCGVGLHPILYSKNNPGSGLIALERTVEKYGKFQRRHERHQLANLFPIHGDGLNWLANNSNALTKRFDKIFLLYPNPYPKNTQRNKRFLGMTNFSYALASLKEEGIIIMRSNERTYLDEAKYLAANVWKLDCIQDQEINLKEGERGITHFERKYLDRGLPCYEIIWRKSKN